MHVRRNRRRIIERAGADETESLNSCIFAPHCGLTNGAAKNPMRPAAVGAHATRRSSHARLLSSRSIGLTSCRDLSLSSPHPARRTNPLASFSINQKKWKRRARAARPVNEQRSDHMRWPKEPPNPNCVTAIFEDFAACGAYSNSAMSPFDHHDPPKNQDKAATAESPAYPNRCELEGICSP